MSVTIHIPTIDAIADESLHRERQEEYAMRAAFLMQPYVPLRDNTLRPSVMASDFATGLLTWSTPYAMKQYAVPMNHSEAGTTDHWDEAMKREHMPELEEYVAKMYEEG